MDFLTNCYVSEAKPGREADENECVSGKRCFSINSTPSLGGRGGQGGGEGGLARQIFANSPNCTNCTLPLYQIIGSFPNMA